MYLKSCNSRERMSKEIIKMKESVGLELPPSNKSMGGALYFFSFIDNYSRKLWVYLLNLRMKSLLHLRNFMHLRPPKQVES